MWYVLVILGGYLLGCSNMALYLSKIKKVRMDDKGSGNLGASNALMLMGVKAGVMVGAHDIGKAWLAVLLARWIFPELAFAGELAGAACILGHMFPFYLKFKGGKGFASYIGAALGLNFWLGLAVSAAVIVIMVVTDYIVISTVMTVLVVPVAAGLLAGSVWPTVILLVPTVIILYKHRINFARIKDGTEFKVSSAFKGKHRVDK